MLKFESLKCGRVSMIVCICTSDSETGFFQCPMIFAERIVCLCVHFILRFVLFVSLFCCLRCSLVVCTITNTTKRHSIGARTHPTLKWLDSVTQKESIISKRYNIPIRLCITLYAHSHTHTHALSSRSLATQQLIHIYFFIIWIEW